MATYNYDPDKCLAVLHKLAEEISSTPDVSVRSFPDIKMNNVRMQKNFKNSLKQKLKEGFDRGWEEFNIPERMRKLGELQASGEITEICDNNDKAIEAESLIEKRDMLKAKLEKLKKKSEETSRDLCNMYDTISCQIEKVNSEFSK